MKHNYLSIAYFIVLFTNLFLLLPMFQTYLGGAEGGLFFYNTAGSYDKVANTWYTHTLGSPTSIFLTGKLTFLLLDQLIRIGISEYVLQFAFLSGIQALGIYGIREIVISLYGRNDTPRFTWISATIFYLYNPITLQLIWSRMMMPYIFFYLTLPFFFSMCRGLLERFSFARLFVFLIVSLVLAPIFAAFPLMVLFWVIMGLGLLSHIISHSKLGFTGIFRPIISFITLLISWVISHIWWIAPFIYTLQNSRYLTAVSYNRDSNILTFSALSMRLGKILNIFQLLHPEWTVEYNKSWGSLYVGYVQPILPLFLLLLIAGGILKHAYKRAYTFWVVVFLITIFAMKGLNVPFGGVNLSLMQSFRFLEGFRNPFEKIGLILPFTMLIPLTISLRALVTAIARVHVQKLLVHMVFCVFCLLSAYPLITGQVWSTTITAAGKAFRASYLNHVPNRYSEANRLITARDDDSRILVWPIVKGEGALYNWLGNKYLGVELSSQFFNNPTLSLYTSFEYLPQVLNELKSTAKTNPESFMGLLRLLNIRYIIQRSDLDPTLHAEELKEKLPDIKGVKLVKEIDGLTISELQAEQRLPKIYAASQVGIMPKNIITPQIPYQSFDALLYPDGSLLETQEATSTPELSYTRINNAKYIVHIRNAQNSFYLVLSESFHNLWQATSEQGIESQHLLANGFANAWYIKGRGSYDMTIEFLPERLHEKGSLISIGYLGLLGCLVLATSAWGLASRRVKNNI